MNNFTKLSLPYIIAYIICFMYILFVPTHWFFTSIFIFMMMDCIFIISLLCKLINLKNKENL